MLLFNIDCGNTTKTIYQSDQSVQTENVWTFLEQNLGLQKDNFYMVHNGRLIYENDILNEGTVILKSKLLGGKGGFGSMLRAIGAQIEKTTNREACRDLSGRRLRDINEEKRLKAWIEKQAEREKEVEEKKKKKLEKLCAVPKHYFDDKDYEEQRSKMTEQISDAIEAAFKTQESSEQRETSVKKRSSEHKEPPAKKKRRGPLEEELELDLDQISDISDDEETLNEKKQLSV